MTITKLKKINFKKLNGLIPAIIQNASTKQVLMVGFMNQEAFNKTLRTKKVWFYSRTKKRLWMKGEQSKNILRVVSIAGDCDRDTILVQVTPAGPACHTGEESCFSRKNRSRLTLLELYNVINERKNASSNTSYTGKLFKMGRDTIVQKIGEEAAEVIVAGKNSSKHRLIEESSDLLYHLLVLLVKRKITIENIYRELGKRHKITRR